MIIVLTSVLIWWISQGNDDNGKRKAPPHGVLGSQEQCGKKSREQGARELI